MKPDVVGRRPLCSYPQALWGLTVLVIVVLVAIIISTRGPAWVLTISALRM